MSLRKRPALAPRLLAANPSNARKSRSPHPPWQGLFQAERMERRSTERIDLSVSGGGELAAGYERYQLCEVDANPNAVYQAKANLLKRKHIPG